LLLPAVGTCVDDLEVIAPDGSHVLHVPNLAPDSYYSRPEMAELDGRFLITWLDDRTSYALVVDADGSVVTPLAIPLGARPFALADGFLVVWAEYSGSYNLLRALRLDREGVAAQGPAWLIAPEGELLEHPLDGLSLLAGNSGDSLAMAWEGEQGVGSGLDPKALFRQVDCLAEDPVP